MAWTFVGPFLNLRRKGQDLSRPLSWSEDRPGAAEAESEEEVWWEDGLWSGGVAPKVPEGVLSPIGPEAFL